jgi:hypothetical protein
VLLLPTTVDDHDGDDGGDVRLSRAEEPDTRRWISSQGKVSIIIIF